VASRLRLDPLISSWCVSPTTALLEELGELERLGQKVDYNILTGQQARDRAPMLTDHVEAAVQLHDQRFIDPPQYLAALADAVRARGAAIIENRRVMGLHDDGDHIFVRTRKGDHRYDAAVIATGAWLPELAYPFGVRVPVQAGRGYSFTVPTRHLPDGPIYLPVPRLACTPLGERLRIAGMMEFRDPDEPLDQRRVQAIVSAAKPFLRGWTSTTAAMSGSGLARAPQTGSPWSARRPHPGCSQPGGTACGASSSARSPAACSPMPSSPATCPTSCTPSGRCDEPTRAARLHGAPRRT
jgi:D-amino-acid dehydrogenase